MKNIKGQKGSITMFVLMSCLFFVAFLIGILSLSALKRQTQVQATKETENIYSNNNQDELYAGYFGEDVVPIYNKEQLEKICSEETVMITEEGGKRYTFNKNSIYVIKQQIEFEYNGIWNIPSGFIENGRIEGGKIKIKDTSKQEETYYYYSTMNKYKYPITIDGYSYNGLVAHYDGINNTGNGHSSKVATWKDLSGNGNDGILKNMLAGDNIKEAYGATWLKVFYHNNKNGTVFFANEAEALSSNTVNKYSVLGRLEEFRNKDGKFEFLLEYPELTGYNRWIQTSNPCTTLESVTGYQAVSISWTTAYWGGLCKSSSTERTFIDGSVNHGYWFYSIGSKMIWEEGKIPGPSSPIEEVYLWVKIDDVLAQNNVKEAYGATWQKVFYHNSKNGTVLFANEAEALNVNTADKYSILGTLENYKMSNGEFEFLLEYPGQAGYNRWAQKSNPCTILETVTGYRGISISWEHSGYWGGISRTNSGVAFLDGLPGDPGWWFAIAPYINYSNGFPGPNGIVVQETYLWVRIDNLNSGWADNALKFDGVDDYVSIGLLKYPNITLESVCEYNSVKLGTASTNEYDNIICSFEGGGCAITNYTLGQYNGFVGHIGGLYQGVKSNNTIAIKKKYSLSGSYNGSMLKFSENGNVTTRSLTGTLAYNATVPFILGSNPSSNGIGVAEFFNGKIYSTRIYNRALTDEEVKNNYEIDKTRFNFEYKIVPIYTKEQLFKINSGEQVNIAEEGKTYVFSTDSVYVIKQPIQFDYNGIWDMPTNFIKEGGVSGERVTIKDTSRLETTYYYYSSNNQYKYAVTADGYSYRNLNLNYDGINNTGSGYSNVATSWKDLSGNGNNGRMNNIATSAWTGNGLTFGSGKYVETISQTGLYGRDMTVEVICSRTASTIADTYYATFASRTSGSGYQDNYLMYIQSGTFKFAGRVGLGGTILSSIDSNDANIVNKKYVYVQRTSYNQSTNNTSIDLFSNGILLATQTVTGPVYTDANFTTKFGTFDGTAQYFDGIIYGSHIYGRALSNEEIQNNYNVSRLRFDF